MPDTSPNPRATIGGNMPPQQFRFGDDLRTELGEDYAYRVKRRDELVAGARQWLADHPEITSDADAGELAGIIAQIYEETKVVHSEREGVKAPYLTACGIIDGFFSAGIVKPLEEIHALLNTTQTDYLAARARRIQREAQDKARKEREKQDAARREKERAEQEKRDAEEAARKAEAEAKAAQEAIERAAAAGRAAPKTAVEKVKKAETVIAKAETVVAKAETKIARAEETETRADLNARRAVVTATASTAERSRVRGTVAKASIATRYSYRVVDLGLVPAHYMTINDAAVRAAIKGPHGLREIPGLEIFPDEQAINRR